MNSNEVYESYVKIIDESDIIEFEYNYNDCICVTNQQAYSYNDCKKCVFIIEYSDGCYSCYLNSASNNFTLFLRKYYPERFL